MCVKERLTAQEHHEPYHLDLVNLPVTFVCLYDKEHDHGQQVISGQWHRLSRTTPRLHQHAKHSLQANQLTQGREVTR